MPRAVVLLNPRARSAGRARIGRLLTAFSNADWSAEIWAGEGADWSYEAAIRARDSGVEAIFGGGGDGQLARILPAVANTDTALGVVPFGTGNVWAHELGLPLQPELAIARQLATQPHRVDVGRANGRLFLVIASAGLDARIVEVIEREAGPKGWGQLAYPLVGLGVGLSLRGAATRVWLDDEEPVDLNLLACMISNGRLYGGLVPLVPTAQVDDGLLDVVLFPGANPLHTGGHAVRVLAGLHHTDPKVIIRQVRRLRLETLDGGIPVQSDGDPLGTTPLDVEVVPSALLALGYSPIDP